MFESLVNLILTSMFLEMQVREDVSLQNLMNQEYRLPQSGLRENQRITPKRVLIDGSAGVEITAQSALVVDKETDKVLYQKNVDEIRSIASITKLMTALVFLDYNPGWQKEIAISSTDYREGGITYLIAGETLTVNDLLYATLVASSNEGAAALARITGLSEEEFVSAMNSKAQELGMKKSRFADPTGLSDYNESTAVDIMLLAKAAFADDHIRLAVSQIEHNIRIINKGITRNIVSTDRILKKQFGLDGEVYSVVAGKTGYLKKAGYCFVSLVMNDQGEDIITVVLGSPTIDDRFTDTKSLAYWVFSNYIWQ